MNRKAFTIVSSVLSVLAVAVFAAVISTAFSIGSFAADDDGYTYNIFIYSGKEGAFDEGKTLYKVKGLEYGEKYTIDLDSLGIKVKDPDKYYVRGLKLAGHDNDEVSEALYQSYTFDVTEDLSFSVAYGIKGGMVKYTVNYVDESGRKLRESDNRYGMAGDKPVVSYRYIEGYIPDMNNAVKRLTDKESENVFTFTYKEEKGDNGSGNTGDENGGGGKSGSKDGDKNRNSGNNGGGNNNGDSAGAAGGQVVNVNDTDPSSAGGNTGDIVDLDDGDTPLAGQHESEQSNINTAAVLGISAGIIAAALAAVFIIRRRRDTEEAEEDTEE